MIKEGTWETRKSLPTGIFIFKVDCFGSREFYDDSVKLEEKLPLILAEIEFKAAEVNRFREENRREEAIRAERQRIENDIKERREREINNFKQLLKESNNWRQSVILENYIQEVERRAIENNTLTEELKTWLKWAKEKADWFNPFIKTQDDIFNENDRILF